jgi:hypothetical protein
MIGPGNPPGPPKPRFFPFWAAGENNRSRLRATLKDGSFASALKFTTYEWCI